MLRVTTWRSRRICPSNQTSPRTMEARGWNPCLDPASRWHPRAEWTVLFYCQVSLAMISVMLCSGDFKKVELGPTLGPKLYAITKIHLETPKIMTNLH